MHEAYEGRMWAAHHEQLSNWVGDALAAIGRGLNRLAGWDGSSHKLLAIVAALAVTLVTFKGTTA
jgi:hypothetical protein